MVDSNSACVGSKYNSMNSIDSIRHFFKTTSPCQSKAHINNVKLLEKVVAIHSYSIPTNVMLVSNRARRTLSIPLITCTRPLKTPKSARNYGRAQNRFVSLPIPSQLLLIPDRARQVQSILYLID